MALSTATITFDISDQLGNDFDPRRTKVWVTTNVPGDTIVDTTGNQIRLGSGNVTVNADGTGSIVVWVPGAGSNPDSWQTTIHVDYPDRNEPRGRGVVAFGPFTITTNTDLADLVEEQAVPPTYLTTVTEALDGYVDSASAAATAAAASATSAAASADLATGGGSLANRLDGVNDHGNVTGTLTIDPAYGYHIFDATGPTEITLGTPPGYSVAFKAITGADDVTVDGLADLTLTDDQWATFVYYRSAWHLAAAGAASGGGTVEPVTDPPTQPGTVTVTPTDDGYELSWVASTVAAGYEVQIDGGTWVDSGAGTTHTHTGLEPASEHSGAVRAYNSEGERSTSRAWGPASVNSVGLHEQLLALDAPVYLDFTNGTLVDHGDGGIVWTQEGSVANDYDGGPAMGPGDAYSARFLPESGLRGTNLGTTFDNHDSATVIALCRVINVGGSGLMQIFGVGGFDLTAGTESYEWPHAGSVHLFVGVVEPGQPRKVYVDGIVRGVSVVWNNAAAVAPTDESYGLWMFRNRQFGAYNSGGCDLARFVVLPGYAMQAEEVMALTVAADTVGNPQ